MIDLKDYTAKGYPGNIDEALKNVPVKGIDREQSQNCVRFCHETDSVLYGADWSPRRICYAKSVRPMLERIVADLPGAGIREQALAAMAWVAENVRHPYVTGPLPPDRALSEEKLIESGIGWCNEQARVFVGLCEVMEIPARLCFLFHANNVSGHTTTEVLIDGRWAFFDQTFDLAVELPDGRLAEARELSGAFRDLAHEAYRPLLERFYANMAPFAKDDLGWGPAHRPTVERGGDLMHTLGFCNYLIEGVTPR